MRATESLPLTRNHHSVVFLDENMRLYTGYCATVTQPLFQTSANKFYHIHLVYSGYHENVPVNFMTNWLRHGAPVSKPLLVTIWQENISDLFASLAITTRPSRLVIRLSHIQASALQPIDYNESRTHLYSQTKIKTVHFPARSKQSHTLRYLSVRNKCFMTNTRVTVQTKKGFEPNSNSIVRIWLFTFYI